MSHPPIFLTVDQVLEIHARMVREFGGDDSLRDHGLLESAVRMPRATFDGRLLHADVAAMAAASLFHLCKNHPFVDGNKRAALATAEVFLLVNDCALSAQDAAVEELTMGVASGSVSKQQVTAFFQDHVRPM